MTPLLISGEGQPPVMMGLTTSSYAQIMYANVFRVEADTDAMAFIAHAAGVHDSPALPLPPLAMVVRGTALSERRTGGVQDIRLPRHQGQVQGKPVMYTLNSPYEAIVERMSLEVLVEQARAIGAAALTEVSITDWSAAGKRAGAFAAGLVMGQVPLDLPAAPTMLERALNRRRSQPTRQQLDRIQRVSLDPKMPEPFVIEYVAGT